MLRSEERWGSNGFGMPSMELVEFVESLGLQYLPLIGSEFTIFEKGKGYAWSRLDRSLIKDRSRWFDRVI